MTPSDREVQIGAQPGGARRGRLRKWVEADQVPRAVVEGEPVEDAAEPIAVRRVP